MKEGVVLASRPQQANDVEALFRTFYFPYVSPSDCRKTAPRRHSAQHVAPSDRRVSNARGPRSGRYGTNLAPFTVYV